MKNGYENKMIKPKNKTINVPKYIGGVELDFKIDGKTIRVKTGDYLPELPVIQAKQRKDFVITKRRKK
jgi:hypothetical protein